jgi:hypothetical protein
MVRKVSWLGALLPLALVTSGWAAEPAPDVGATVEQGQPEPPGFDLRSESVRKLVQATAATQANTEYRIETTKPPRTQADLIEALRRQGPPVVKEEPPAPRLPERPPPCDGFWSCGIEALLGVKDYDDEVYGRVMRHRLMNQGSFTDSSKIHQSVPLPVSPGAQGDTGPLRPR